MTTLANRIWLRGGFVYEEAPANATIYPGFLIDWSASGGVNYFIPHATVGGASLRLFAIENSMSGPSLFENAGGQTVATSYVAASGGVPADLVPAISIYPGGSVNAFLKGGYKYSIGQKLISAGTGYLEPQSAVTSQSNEANIVGEVWDTALDLSSTTTNNQLGPVMVR